MNAAHSNGSNKLHNINISRGEISHNNTRNHTKSQWNPLFSNLFGVNGKRLDSEQWQRRFVYWVFVRQVCREMSPERSVFSDCFRIFRMTRFSLNLRSAAVGDPQPLWEIPVCWSWVGSPPHCWNTKTVWACTPVGLEHIEGLKIIYFYFSVACSKFFFSCDSEEEHRKRLILNSMWVVGV